MQGMGRVKFPEEGYSHNANSDNLRCQKNCLFFLFVTGKRMTDISVQDTHGMQAKVQYLLRLGE
jgi:hypothetical protein